jgi:Tfp pilus assembly protein PilF
MTQRILIAIAFAALLACASTVGAQAKQGSDVGETYNPFLAEKDLEVGMYYLKTKNYDAAIERLKSALVHRPNYARPRWYLAEAHEKKGEYAEAIEYYREFVEIMKTGKEADKAREQITKLTKRIEQKKTRKS